MKVAGVRIDVGVCVAEAAWLGFEAEFGGHFAPQTGYNIEIEARAVSAY